jgi:hypothetical protein
VLTSRHRHACIVVTRAGIPQLLDAHPSSQPVHLNVPAKFPDGWEANHAMLAHRPSSGAVLGERPRAQVRPRGRGATIPRQISGLSSRRENYGQHRHEDS